MDDAERILHVARYGLFNAMGLPTDQQKYSIQFMDSLKTTDIDIKQIQALAQLEEQPLSLSALMEYQAEQNKVKEARSNILPDIRFNLYKQNYGDGFNYNGFEVGLSIPIWLPFEQKGKIEMAKAREVEIEWRQKEIELDMKMQIEHARHKQIDLERYQQTIRKKAESLQELSLKAYRLGEIDLLNLISSQQIYLSSQKQYLSAGVVFPAPGNLSFISTPIEGRVSAINVREGNRVRKGQELFRIESLVFGNLVAEFMQANAEEKYQKSRMVRMEQLVQEIISSKSELERANSDFQRATALVIASIAKLKAIGVTDREIENFKNAERIDPTLRIYSAIDGFFDQQEVELGQSINALEKMGRVINLSKVQVKAYLSPDDGAFVSEGDTVLVTRRNENAKKIMGRVETINPALDETNRSMVANIIINTVNNWPQPGETVRLEIMTGTLDNVLSVPVAALTYEGNQPIVFVKKGDRQFEKREITLREIRDDYAILSGGLEVGEQVAITQVFSLKALSRYELIAEE